jgi:D-glycero-alpha-D-manno-heptose-7-phosphate kinase
LTISPTTEVVARAPARIDLGGGWTDVPPYCDREGGFVCNIAISRHSTATLRSGDGTQDPLAQAAIRRSGITGVGITMQNDFPTGAGLGGSSAASAAILGAIARARGEAIERADIAEEGRRIEVEELGIAGGRQDHYAATHGGALGLTFTGTVDVSRIALTLQTKKEIVRRSTLVYTGESRVSGDTITAVLGAYEAGTPAVVGALRRMREIAIEMAAALRKGDVDSLGSLLDEHWAHQRSLHPTIPTARIDEIVEVARREGALGAKAMGASGGGCVLVIARSDNPDRVRRAVSRLGKTVDFDIDETGLTILRSAN